MSAAARLHDPLLPRPPGGLGEGAVLALLAHAALIAALSLGVQWRASTPETFSAELWAAVPRLAAPAAEAVPAEPAPAAAAPPPAPATVPKAPAPEPDIAIERARRERERERQAAEQARLEHERLARADKERKVEAERRERSERAEQEARERKAAEARLARQREENLRRMLGQAGAAGGTGAPGSTGSAAQDAGPSRGYASRLVAHIKPNIVFTDSISGNPAAEVEVRAGATGTIVSRRLVKSSGVKEWDDAVLRAIDRTGSLPRDVDGRVPPLLLIAFRPND